MYRKDLIDLLLDNPLSVKAIAESLEMPVRDVVDDLEHLIKTLRHGEHRLEITPARCRKCGFRFHKDKITRPSRCPHCHGTWISDPLLQVAKKP